MINLFDPPNLILVNLPNSSSKVFVVVMMILLLLCTAEEYDQCFVLV